MHYMKTKEGQIIKTDSPQYWNECEKLPKKSRARSVPTTANREAEGLDFYRLHSLHDAKTRFRIWHVSPDYSADHLEWRGCEHL
jgi:hypothetical protein